MSRGARAVARRDVGDAAVIRIARERYAAGDLAFAERLALSLADELREPAEMLVLAGRAALRRSAFDVLEAVSQRLLACGGPGTLRAQALRGAAAGRTGDLDGARRALEPILHADAGNCEAAYDLALAYWNARELDAAEALLERFSASATGLDQVAFVQLRGWIEVRRERYSAAIRFFDDALRRYAALDQRDVWLFARMLQAVSGLSMETLDLPMLPQLETLLPRDALGEAREPLFHATQNVGWLAMLAGRPLDALAYFEQARSLACTPALRSVASLNIATYHRLRSGTAAAKEYLVLAHAELAEQHWREANVDERMTLLEYALEAYHLEPHTAAGTLTRYLSHTKRRQGNLAFEDDARVEAIELMARGLLEAIHRRPSSALEALRRAGAIWGRLGYRYRETLTALLVHDVGGDETSLREAARAAVSAPKSWLREEIERRTGLASTGAASLTPAERRVMLAICEGKSSKQIAADFERSFHTIRNQTLNVYQAMGVRSRGALIAQCARLGLLAPQQRGEGDDVAPPSRSARPTRGRRR